MTVECKCHTCKDRKQCECRICKGKEHWDPPRPPNPLHVGFWRYQDVPLTNEQIEVGQWVDGVGWMVPVSVHEEQDVKCLKCSAEDNIHTPDYAVHRRFITEWENVNDE